MFPCAQVLLSPDSMTMTMPSNKPYALSYTERTPFTFSSYSF